MTERVPPTPRPKLTLLSSEEETLRGEPVPKPQTCAPEPGFAGAASNPDDALRSRAERKKEPLGAAMTLVGAAHTTLLAGLRGQPGLCDDWTETRTVVEMAMRYLIMAQAQRVVEVDGPYPHAGKSSLLEALRQLTRLAQQAHATRGHESERVWQLARRLELVDQCLYDWTSKRGVGVEPEELFALARELQFVYRDLQLLAVKPTRGRERGNSKIED